MTFEIISTDENILRPYYDKNVINTSYPIFYKSDIGLIDTKTKNPISYTISKLLLGRTNLKQNQLSARTYSNFLLKLNKDYLSKISEKEFSSAKNYSQDLEFQEYFEKNNITQLFKNLLWGFVKNYSKVFLSHPFELLKLLLQVGIFFPDGNNEVSKKTKKTASNKYSDDIKSNFLNQKLDYFYDPTEESVFDSAEQKENKNKNKNHISTIRCKKNKIKPKSTHTMDVMLSIVSKYGPFALFSGLNAQFIYITFSNTIEAWITGFISPFLKIPDPFFLNFTHSNNPSRSLWLSVTACILTGLLLMPLDLIKVKLMVTQFNSVSLKKKINEQKDKETEIENYDSEINLVSNSRSIKKLIRYYPKKILIKPPLYITLLTILHQFSTCFFRKVIPYLLFIKLNIDFQSSPFLYTIVNLILLFTELFIKLPIENLKRKEQVRFLLKPKSLLIDKMRVLTIEDPDNNLIVEFNDLWNSKTTTLDQYKSENKNKFLVQNNMVTLDNIFIKIKMLGLFNSWRIGVLNVVGFWGYNIIRSLNFEMIEVKL